ncbi:MAG: crossover junction endodeoxyribonuclease RuvC [Candidatus Sungbacteria bacterium]|nr:crossover junction endodeoxyribonuclease RuvC [bacterium]MDZ4260039.1 crossover junction endodeoxyribonuclease RuvC [Candidatus Sungbacteria bacterium]
MIILGIDPGTTSVGYAILDCAHNRPTLVEARLLPIHSAYADERLMDIHREIKKIIAKWKPDIASVEKLFFSKNVKTAMTVSEARGVILLTASLAGIKVYEYTPLTIKKVVTGDGNADKTQVQKMVRLTLKEATHIASQDDVFDSIASALCCFYQEGRGMRIV